MNPRVFREYDIRGHAEKDFPDAFVTELGRSMGAYFVDNGARRITLGRDCRLSSPRIHAALKRELLASGLDVVDVGIVHTPALYFSVFHLNADGALSYTQRAAATLLETLTATPSEGPPANGTSLPPGSGQQQ